jgi:hypothetical protein
MAKLIKTNEYLDCKKRVVEESPHLEPIKFIGFLELYWSDVFQITPGLHIYFLLIIIHSHSGY